ARGTNSSRETQRPECDLSSSETRYCTSDSSVTPTPSIGVRLLARIDLNRSALLPSLRNFGVQPAYGPNNRPGLPLMTRVSRCGTDIGGAPTAALPYTLASCVSISAGLVQRRNWPLTGKPAMPLISLIDRKSVV